MALEELKGVANIFSHHLELFIKSSKVPGMFMAGIPSFVKTKISCIWLKKNWQVYLNMMFKFELCLIQVIANF